MHRSSAVEKCLFSALTSYSHREVVEEALPAGGPLQEVVDVALEGVPHSLLVPVDVPAA